MNAIKQCRAEMERRAQVPQSNNRIALVMAIVLVVYFLALAVVLSALGITLHG